MVGEHWRQCWRGRRAKGLYENKSVIVISLLVKFSNSPWPQNSLCWILPTWIDNIFQTDKLSFCYRGCKTWRYLIFMSFMLTLFMIFVPWYESLKEQAYCMLSMFLSMLTWWLLMFVNAIRPCLESTNHWVGIPNLGMKNGIVPHV